MSTPPGATDRDRPVPLPGPRTPSGAPSQSGGHMVVCGGDALAHRLAVELADRYGTGRQVRFHGGHP
ncbi:hypothetical protein [Kitasatospora sp. NPDC048407]|uniref:hypothetical protein n=1 Tax=Kitasatospora sp. NPDC048407 TaxID=3364051 RepID=UPI003710DC57